jgi:hypothetical protein
MHWWVALLAPGSGATEVFQSRFEVERRVRGYLAGMTSPIKEE